MKTDFYNVLVEVDKLNKLFNWEKAYNKFWVNISEETHDSEITEQLLKDIGYFYSRYIEFTSCILHHNLRPDVMFGLSSDYIKILELELEKTPDVSSEVLPGIESICNHLLMTAETDYLSFFVSLYTLNQVIFKRDELKNFLSGKQREEFVEFIELLNKWPYTLKHMSKSFHLIDKIDLQRILNNNYALCETIDYWFEELLEKYQKKMITAPRYLI
ncbi:MULTISPECIES: hypothetical protein [Bacillus]|uniref:Uncharacterized protein n=1 Tax=Bacillus rugosus TaxID=2715209 RepID=A0ACD3ZYG0_9BACI|nr:MULTISPECIES: hypothetical protein [Bacillus]MBY4602883.1 hypothetical protein [Bacillus sp. SPARC3]UPV78971.1 hypothetical protein M0696_19595 [Bacillus rugosus]